MAQKQYGIIPHDTSQVGYGQDEPVVTRRETKERFVNRMVSKIMKHRKKKKKKKKEGYGTVTQELKTNVKKRQQALDEASK